MDKWKITVMVLLVIIVGLEGMLYYLNHIKTVKGMWEHSFSIGGGIETFTYVFQPDGNGYQTLGDGHIIGKGFTWKEDGEVLYTTGKSDGFMATIPIHLSSDGTMLTIDHDTYRRVTK